MSDSILQARDVTVRFGGIFAASEVSFDVPRGSITGLIGPNGAGKTTMVNCISGVYRPTSGEIMFDGAPLGRDRPHQIARRGLARTFQAAALFGGMTSIEMLMLGRYVHGRTGMFRGALMTPAARRDEIVQRIKAEEILEMLSMEAYRDDLVKDLPYGLQKRLDLGRALAQEPKLMLLDEPMAGMNPEEKSDLAVLINDAREHFGITQLLIEHDMGVVMKLVDHVVVLNFGKRIAEGSPAQVQQDPEVIEAYLGAETDEPTADGSATPPLEKTPLEVAR